MVERGGVYQHQERLVKRSDQVLALDEIDPRFSADRGVDLREKGCRDLNDVDAAHVARGQETSYVTRDAAAKGDDAGGAVGAGGIHLFGEGLELRQALSLFSGLKRYRDKRHPGQARFQSRPLVFPGALVGDDEKPAFSRQGADVLGGAIEHARVDDHVVGAARCSYPDPLHASLFTMSVGQGRAGLGGATSMERRGRSCGSSPRRAGSRFGRGCGGWETPLGPAPRRAESARHVELW